MSQWFEKEYYQWKEMLKNFDIFFVSINKRLDEGKKNNLLMLANTSTNKIIRWRTCVF